MSDYTQESPALVAEGHNDTTDPSEFDSPSYLIGSQEGTSVAISEDGLTAIVGAPGADEQPPTAFAAVLNEGFPQETYVTAYEKDIVPGAVYIWKFNELTEEWEYTQKLTPEGSLSNYVYFGSSVAISADGNIIVIGGPLDGYFQELTRYGGSPTIYGVHLVHGADNPTFPGETTILSPPTQMGTVWIYVKNPNTGLYELNNTLRSTFDGVETAIGGLFGKTVAISSDGTSIAVGDPISLAGGTNGKVHIYTSEEDAYNWSLNTVFSSAETQALGQSIAFGGNNKLVMGAPVWSDEITEFVPLPNGTIWIATRDEDGNWNASEILEGDYGFGISVSASETTIVVSSFYYPAYGGTGQLKTYDWELQEINSFVPSALGSSLGSFVRAFLNKDADVLFISSLSYNSDIYIRSGSNWIFSETISPNDIVDNPTINSINLAYGGIKVILGGPSNDDSIGAAWIFKGIPIPIQYWGSVVNLAAV